MPVAAVRQELTRSSEPTGLQLPTVSKERWTILLHLYSQSADTKVLPPLLQFHQKVTITATWNEQHCFNVSMLCSWNILNSVNAYLSDFLNCNSLWEHVKEGQGVRTIVVFIVSQHIMVNFLSLSLCKRWKPPSHFSLTDHTSEHASCVDYLNGSKCFAED